MKFKTLITAVFVLSVFNFAQAQLAMGKWRTHLAFNSVEYRDWETDRKSTRLNSSHSGESRMPSSA